MEIDAALVSHPRDIYYLSGIWVEDKVYDSPSLLLLGPGIKSWLGSWDAVSSAVVDERDAYSRGILSTMNPDNHRRLARLAQAAGQNHAGGLKHIGFQAEGGHKFILDCFLSGAGAGSLVSIDPVLQRQQLRKDADEIACIQNAINAASAAYRRAAEVIEPGVNELTVLGECIRAAIAHSGAPHYFGGDFRSGERGGPARDRCIESGELFIIDAQADVGGYWCDLSRVFAVGGSPTAQQESVHEHLARLLREVPKMVRPGKSCTEFWHELDARIRDHANLADHGLQHHGGHGIGLRAHEGPDINRDRDGRFDVGNVFTVEPGAYLPALRAGVRVEDNFLIADNGVRTLSTVPLDLITTNCIR